jgi:phosphoglycerate kinase
LQEADLHDTAREILEKAAAAKCRVILPVDLVVAREFRANAPHETVPVNAVPADAMALDLGKQSLATLTEAFQAAKTLVWNGPLGAFETVPFDAATVAAARSAASLTEPGKLLSVAGGGDTVAALRHAGVAETFSYVSTAGGAFLEWMEGKELPGVAALGH